MWGSSAGAARAEHQSWSGRSAGTGDGEGREEEEAERRRGGRSEAEEDLEDCARKVRVDGDGDFFFGPCVCIQWERDKADVGWPGWCALVVPEAVIHGR